MKEPLKLRKRPHFKGFPIPATVKVRGGIPDFADINWPRAFLFGKNRQCALCGYVIREGYVAFLGGPNALKNRLWRDGPMHEECARYACTVCPFLVGSKTEYRKTSVVDPTMEPHSYAPRYHLHVLGSHWRSRPRLPEPRLVA